MGHGLVISVTIVVGFLINPIAGMGGRVALKGTDGVETQKKAKRRGAVPTAAKRAAVAVRALASRGLDMKLLTCAGAMGGDVLQREGLRFTTVLTPPKATTALDTKMAVTEFVSREADIILFCGGDGTARDIVEVAGLRVPIVGIPGGVKMHSSVFALRAEDAAELIESYARSRRTREGEVLDVDEDDYRAGRARPRIFALARVPDDRDHLQAAKSTYSEASAEAEAEALGAYVANAMEQRTLYLIGPGSTTEAIAKAMGQDKTALGVDAYIDGKLVGRDLTESDALALMQKHDRRGIIVTPIGAQGFIFGRGNQQLSPRVIRAVGADGVMIIATPTKLRNTPALHVDSGDDELDTLLRRPFKVVTGAGRRRLMKVV